MEEENKTENPELEKTEELEKALAEEKAKVEANLAGWQRSQADFVNYKRFAEQEKADIIKNANAGLLANILPILDDLERAISSLPAEEAHQKWAEGFKLIERKFKDILKRQRITQIQVLGMEFDPYTMEALTTAPGKKDMVIMEVEKGYKIQDKVIRPARVIVGNGEEPPKEKKTEKG